MKRLLPFLLAFVALPAAAVDFYLVVDGDDVVVGYYQNQALADAVANADADHTAIQGAVDVDITVGLREGYTYTAGDGLQPPVDDPSDVVRLQRAAEALHRQLNVWAAGLDAESMFEPAAVVSLGHDFLYRAHQAAALIMTNSNNDGDTSYSVAQRIAWAQAMATGAANVTSPAEFFAHVRTADADDDEDALLTTPTGPTAWVRMGTGDTVIKCDLEEAVMTCSGDEAGELDIYDDPDPSGVNAAGAWIADISG